MSNDKVSQETPAQLGQYEQGFIAAVLYLNGAGTPPSLPEFERAIAKFREFASLHHPHLVNRH